MTEQNRTCPRCKAPYKPDYNYCAICGLKLNPEQKAAARTTALREKTLIQELEMIVPEPIDRKRLEKLISLNG